MTEPADALAELQARHDRLNAEFIALRDRDQRRMTNARIDGDRTRSAARRDAQDHMLGLAESYADAAVRESMHDIAALIYRTETLPDRPSRGQVASLRTAAGLADRRIRLATDRDNVADVAHRVHAEVRRLRAYVMASGRAIHDVTGRDPNGCDCTGCLLIIGMDLLDGDAP